MNELITRPCYAKHLQVDCVQCVQTNCTYLESPSGMTHCIHLDDRWIRMGWAKVVGPFNGTQCDNWIPLDPEVDVYTVWIFGKKI